MFGPLLETFLLPDMFALFMKLFVIYLFIVYICYCYFYNLFINLFICLFTRFFFVSLSWTFIIIWFVTCPYIYLLFVIYLSIYFTHFVIICVFKFLATYLCIYLFIKNAPILEKISLNFPPYIGVQLLFIYIFYLFCYY